MKTKKQLRKICLNNRQNLTVDLRKQYSQIICNKLLTYIDNKMVMSYLPYNNEVDLSYINNNTFAYPVIKNDNMMDAYITDNDYIENKYHILEPDINKSTLINKNDIDIVIVPCVGFDENKYRLGYGGGYYDRYLKDLSALKIGVAFEIQKVDNIPYEKNDIVLDIIISEDNIYQ